MLALIADRYDARPKPMPPKLRADTVQLLPGMVLAFASFWTLGPLRPAPMRRVGKVGRNDPCPCGSGLKFKKCCVGKPVGLMA